MVTKKIFKTVFKFRRALESTWTEVNPILELGEPAYSYDVQRLKIGDGRNHWRNLRYLDSTQDLDEVIEKLNNLYMSDIKDSSDYATKIYVDENGGKINSISVNGVIQPIDYNKNVDLNIINYNAGNGITIINQQISIENNLIIDCGTSTIGV